MADYSLNVGNLPQGACPTTYQAMLNLFGAALSVSIPTASGITVSATKPSDTSSIWFQIDSLGRFLRMYIYGQGSWLSSHPIAPGLTMWWFDTLPNFTTFDGGDNNAIGPASGRMWQQAKDGNGTLITAKFPVTAGTLPSTTVLALGDTGGEENHTLLSSEGAQDPTHKHIIGKFQSSGSGCGYVLTETNSNINGTAETVWRTAPSNTPTSSSVDALTGSFICTGIVDPTANAIVGHNTMPPYAVGYLLQRSQRIFYSVT
jgi:hypothetical protein